MVTCSQAPNQRCPTAAVLHRRRHETPQEAAATERQAAHPVPAAARGKCRCEFRIRSHASNIQGAPPSDRAPKLPATFSATCPAPAAIDEQNSRHTTVLNVELCEQTHPEPGFTGADCDGFAQLFAAPERERCPEAVRHAACCMLRFISAESYLAPKKSGLKRGLPRHCPRRLNRHTNIPIYQYTNIPTFFVSSNPLCNAPCAKAGPGRSGGCRIAARAG